MANWITCDYAGIKDQHDKVGMGNNRPVNLDLVATYFYVGSNIIFVIPTKEDVRWEFINDAVMGIELQRVNNQIARGA